MTTTRPRDRHRERRLAGAPNRTVTDRPVVPTLSDPPTPTDRGRRPAVAAAAAAALVATVGATGWAMGHHDPLARSAGAIGPTTLTTAYNSSCGLTGGNAVEPSVAPTADWQDVGITSLPISTAYGPGQRSATASWSCFARTPSGAVLAAWTIPFRADVAKDFAGVVHRQTVPGPGQDALLKLGQVAHPLTDRVEPLGFKLVNYSPDAATVDFHVTQYSRHFHCAAVVQWAGGTAGDWLLRLQPDGNALATCQPLPDDRTEQFVPWGPLTAAR
jgi:hypothetical protein